MLYLNKTQYKYTTTNMKITVNTILLFSNLSESSFSIIITSRSDLSLGSESAVFIASAKSAKNNVSPAVRSVALRLKPIRI